MKIKSLMILHSLFLGFLMTLGSCSSEDITEDASSGGMNDVEGQAVVNFTLDNKSAFFGEPKVASREVVTELQTTEEKHIENLMAIVFRGSKVPVESHEKNTDKFVMAKEITPVPQDQGNFSFSLGEEGNLWVCFVANAGNTLKEQMKGLTSAKTVQDFKNLLSDVDADAAHKMMVSEFYNIDASFVHSATIPLVTMTRIMARIDIANASDGVTITKIVFHNRSVKTKLINDGNVVFEAGMLEGADRNKTYEIAGDALKGNSESPSVYKSKIYTYEQFAAITNDQSTERPYLEVHYKVDGDTKTYKHDLYFQDNSDSPGTRAATAVPLKRNTLYTVTVKNSKSNIVFGITVKDWVAGKTFQVTTDQLIHGATTGPDYSNVAVGDFMLKDGTIVKPEAVSTRKQDVIGVVFCTDESRIGAKAKEKLGGKAHGLVMALKEAGSGLAWKNENTTSGLPFKNNMKDCYEDINGYDNTQKIFDKGGSDWATKYPAFNAVKTYETQNKSPQGTTGWYLPAIGEWYDIVEKLGNVTIKDEFKTGSATGNQILKNQQGTQINSITTANNINTHLKKIGESYVNEFDVTSSQYRYYWSSSEYNETNARYMYFNHNGSLYVNYYNKTYANSNYRVRCVLAF